MELYVLNNKYEIVGVIDATESTLWNKKYNDAGYCEIYVPCDVATLELLQKGNYIYRYDDDMFCRIETREITTNAEQGDYIIATATDVSKTLLSGRIVRWQIVYSGTVGGFVKKLLTDNVTNPAQAVRRVSNFVIDDSNFADFSEHIEASAVTDDLFNIIQTTCKTDGIGFRVSYDIEQRKFVFRLYRGKNKASATGDEYVEFSPQFANIISSSYKDDDTNRKNVVYVGYKNAADEFNLLSLFQGDTEPQGEERREIYVDGTGTSRDITYEELKQMFPTVAKTSKTVDETVTSTYYITVDGVQTDVATSEGEGEEEQITITDYTYLLLIRRLGNDTLAQYTTMQEISGDVDTIDTYVYKTDYDLGDTVKVINEYGIEAAARIVEIMESNDNDNGYVVEPIFEFIN